MSEPIKVGDMVVVVRGMPCCGHSTPMQGHIFRVAQIRERTMTRFPCLYCAAESDNPAALGGEKPVDLCRLKRIPPLSELEGERTQEDLREPA